MRVNPPPLKLARALDALHRGGVIAYPTEGVWGLGCEPSDEVAVQRLLDLKHREREKGLILVAGNQLQFDWLLEDLPESQRNRLTLSWPGAVTWLVPHRGRVPEWISGQHDTVALRVSAHPVVRNLCLAYGACADKNSRAKRMTFVIDAEGTVIKADDKFWNTADNLNRVHRNTNKRR